MNGGKLQQKIKFFEYPLEPDGAAGFIPGAKVLVLDTWASVRQIKATRTAENVQEVINSAYEIKLRQRSGFNPKSDYIIEWRNKDCEITGITEDVEDRNHWLITVVTNPI